MFPLASVFVGYMSYVMINCVRWCKCLLGSGSQGMRLGSGGGDYWFGRRNCQWSVGICYCMLCYRLTVMTCGTGFQIRLRGTRLGGVQAPYCAAPPRCLCPEGSFVVEGYSIEGYSVFLASVSISLAYKIKFVSQRRYRIRGSDVCSRLRLSGNREPPFLSCLLFGQIWQLVRGIAVRLYIYHFDFLK